MRIATIASLAIFLAACSTKHYSVCMAVGADSGCSHRKFTKSTATAIGALMASQPGSDERTVWIIDTRKHASDAGRAPQPAEQAEKKNDDKI